MTAIIQLTVPDGWANFHLAWAAMALAIMTFGPGKIALDYVLGLDRSRRADESREPSPAARDAAAQSEMRPAQGRRAGASARRRQRA